MKMKFKQMTKPIIVTCVSSSVTFNVFAFPKIMILTWSINVAFTPCAINLGIQILIVLFLAQDCSSYLNDFLH